MYKFPVIKNGIEYGVSIYEDELWEDGYIIKLYKQHKFLNLTFKRKLIEETHRFDCDRDSEYIELLKTKSLYKFLAEYIISNYEKSVRKDDLYYQNKIAFKDWDGKL